MIEVTDEMVDSAALAFTNKPTEATYVNARRMITAAIKTYEANKPKPEPVGYARVVNNRVKIISDTELDSGFRPLYTTPPTREPLSDEEIHSIYMIVYEKASPYYDFARLIEQAHGIGV